MGYSTHTVAQSVGGVCAKQYSSECVCVCAHTQ